MSVTVHTEKVSNANLALERVLVNGVGDVYRLFLDGRRKRTILANLSPEQALKYLLNGGLKVSEAEALLAPLEIAAWQSQLPKPATDQPANT